MSLAQLRAKLPRSKPAPAQWSAHLTAQHPSLRVLRARRRTVLLLQAAATRHLSLSALLRLKRPPVAAAHGCPAAVLARSLAQSLTTARTDLAGRQSIQRASQALDQCSARVRYKHFINACDRLALGCQWQSPKAPAAGAACVLVLSRPPLHSLAQCQSAFLPFRCHQAWPWHARSHQRHLTAPRAARQARPRSNQRCPRQTSCSRSRRDESHLRCAN